MNWPDGLGLWPANAPDTQPESCDDCHGDGLFCKACDQRKSDCECKLGDIDVDRWLTEEFAVDRVDLIDPDDADSTFNDEDYRFTVCLRCGGNE